jgi:AcrR family transcriptional regulator
MSAADFTAIFSWPTTRWRRLKLILALDVAADFAGLQEALGNKRQQCALVARDWAPDPEELLCSGAHVLWSAAQSLTKPPARRIGMLTNPDADMQDRRQDIIEAGLATLRQHGYVGFTQPRVAAGAGLRQSHLTYYHPTRLDLLEAVGRAAVERQLVAVDKTLASQATIAAAAHAIADVIARHENTRVLMALAQASDEEPRLRALFRELADGIVARLMDFLGRVGKPADIEVFARLLHALSVGLAVVDLATGRPDGKQRATRVLEVALTLVAGAAMSAPATEGAPQKGKRR